MGVKANRQILICFADVYQYELLLIDKVVPVISGSLSLPPIAALKMSLLRVTGIVFIAGADERVSDPHKILSFKEKISTIFFAVNRRWRIGNMTRQSFPQNFRRPSLNTYVSSTFHVKYFKFFSNNYLACNQYKFTYIFLLFSCFSICRSDKNNRRGWRNVFITFNNTKFCFYIYIFILTFST